MLGIFGSLVGGLQFAALEAPHMAATHWGHGTLWPFAGFAASLFAFYSLVPRQGHLHRGGIDGGLSKPGGHTPVGTAYLDGMLRLRPGGPLSSCTHGACKCQIHPTCAPVSAPTRGRLHTRLAPM